MSKTQAYEFPPGPDTPPAIRCQAGWYDRPTGPVLCLLMEGHPGRHWGRYDAEDGTEGRVYWGPA